MKTAISAVSLAVLFVVWKLAGIELGVIVGGILFAILISLDGMRINRPMAFYRLVHRLGWIGIVFFGFWMLISASQKNMAILVLPLVACFGLSIAGVVICMRKIRTYETLPYHMH